MKSPRLSEPAVARIREQLHQRHFCVLGLDELDVLWAGRETVHDRSHALESFAASVGATVEPGWHAQAAVLSCRLRPAPREIPHEQALS